MTLTLTLAAALGGANPAQAQALPDPPCAATHFEAPGPGTAAAKCIPKTGNVFATDAEGSDFCEFLGGTRSTFSNNPWCTGDYAKKDRVSGSCQVNRTDDSGCLAIFNKVRDCNEPGSNQQATIGRSSVVTCNDECASGQQAVGGDCRGDAAINCSGDEVPNEAGDACVCPSTKPFRNLAGICTEQCGAGEEPDQAKQCELCGPGKFKTEAGADQCGQCFTPLDPTHSEYTNDFINPVAGLETDQNRTVCLDINECSAENAEARALELCGPNAQCVEQNPLTDNLRYRCECVGEFADPSQGNHENKLNCSGVGDRTVAILASDNGTVSAAPPGDLAFGTEVVFTAAPDSGFMVSAWAGVDEWVGPGNCVAGATRCAVTVTRALEARAVFADADECASDLDDCPSDSSCVNLDAAAGGGRFECDCDDASLDHDSGLGICTGFRTVTILASSGGTVSSGSVGEVTHGSGAVFTAAAALGFTVGAWSGVAEWVGPGNCEAGSARCAVTVTRDVTVGAAFPDLDECAAGSDDCPSASSCVNLDAALGGGRFTCECDLAVSDFGFDEATRACGCATAGHLLFGEGAGRECKSPVICPSGYGDANFDCVEDEAAPLAPEQVSSRELCLAFGGVREAVVDAAHPGVCSNVDINDTFCFLESGEALSCRGLFEHVRDCNALNRPALDPWHCAAACGDKQARGRRCETVTR